MNHLRKLGLGSFLFLGLGLLGGTAGAWGLAAAGSTALTVTRAKETALLEETKEDLRSHIADNPALDAMDAYQWIIFNGAHSKRHTAQIVEVKADANYPKN